MSNSGETECPVCGKAFSLARIPIHVEECLVKSVDKTDKTTTWSFNNSSTNGSKSQNATLNKGWFNQKQNLKGSVDTKLREKSTISPPNQMKRQMPMAGKPNALPNKRLKTGTNFFQTKKPENSIGALFREGKLLENCESDVRSRSAVVDDEGTKQRTKRKGDSMPLAEQMRPCILEDYVGQGKVLGDSTLLRTLLQVNKVPSMVLWGPPGCGKTSLAHIIANNAKKSSTARFVSLSATTSGINDIKEVVKIAKNEKQMFKRKTILFVDEIHRFNKTQQDTFLPHVENGTITLIGATTENPSFQLNTALLSRCRVIVLDKLSAEDLQQLLNRACESMGCVVDDGRGSVQFSSINCSQVVIEKEAIVALSNLCDGDARVALNGLQLAVQSQIAAKAGQIKHKAVNCGSECSSLISENTTLNIETGNGKEGPVRVNVLHIKEGLQRTHLLYDRAGEEHYNCISALHKSLRGSDGNAALYWLARMLVGGEDPLYIARRLVRFASEDVGLADPSALTQAVAAYQACHFIGMPECEVILAQITVYLARAPKSIEVYSAYNNAKSCVNNWDGPHPSVPLHIRNAPTELMKNLGYGAGYKYNPMFDGPVSQTYLPTELYGMEFFKSTKKE